MSVSARESECQKLKIIGLTGMGLNLLNSSNFAELALKGLTELFSLCYSRRLQ